ncbi:MAG: T9SS type A sorting domain-containing protein [Bacteroidetes bacterium]|nr:T9SS type A sorting domain-containing protein [Bacteroidota bacterium]
MKKINLLLIFIFVLNISCFAQNFAPVGATWHYSRGGFTSNTYYPVKLESVKDTVILGLQCRKITGNYYHFGNNNFDYMYSSSAKVYIFDKQLLQFVKIYDFNLNAGDTLKYKLYFNNTLDTNSAYIIDSVGITTINGKTLKVQYTHNMMTFNPYPLLIMGGKIIEGIGSDFFLFPQYINQDPYNNHLRCYSDTSVGYYNTGIVSKCDSIVNNIKEETNYFKLKVYPNPANCYINFDLGLYKDIKLNIYSSMGQNVMQQSIVAGYTIINIRNFKSGIYFYKLTDKTDKTISGKFVKE